MLTHLKLQQFRGFAALDVDLEPLTVVAGPNSSGKTFEIASGRVVGPTPGCLRSRPWRSRFRQTYV